MLVTKLLAVITLFTVMVPRCAVDPNASAVILFKAALTVVVWVPLAIDRFVPAPVSVFKVLAPSVTVPLAVVRVRVPTPERVTSPFSAIRPDPVVIFPAFQTNGPLMVKAALVPVANDRS